ncbi:MAG: hypothetical protein ACJZ1R_04275 [Candidatus Neomarinimicrobiota bacterium]
MKERDIFQIPAILESLIASDRLGQKKQKQVFIKKNEDRSTPLSRSKNW